MFDAERFSAANGSLGGSIEYDLLKVPCYGKSRRIAEWREYLGYCIHTQSTLISSSTWTEALMRYVTA